MGTHRRAEPCNFRDPAGNQSRFRIVAVAKTIRRSGAIEAFYKELIPVSNMVVDVDLYQIDKANFDLPYCETATPQQYALIEECLVKPEKHNDESSENKADKDSKNEDK